MNYSCVTTHYSSVSPYIGHRLLLRHSQHNRSVTRMQKFHSTYIFLVGVEKPECKIAGLGCSSVMAQRLCIACQKIAATQHNASQTSAHVLGNP